MDSAIWGLIGVVVGSAITGFVTIRAEQVRANKEAALDGAKRSDDRRLAHDLFVRETLLALQDAVGEMANISVEMKALQPDSPPAVDLKDRWLVVSVRLLALSSRVAEKEVREFVAKAMNAMGVLTTTKSVEEKSAAFQTLHDHIGNINGSTGVLIRAAFGDPILVR